MYNIVCLKCIVYLRIYHDSLYYRPVSSHLFVLPPALLCTLSGTLQAASSQSICQATYRGEVYLNERSCANKQVSTTVRGLGNIYIYIYMLALQFHPVPCAIYDMRYAHIIYYSMYVIMLLLSIIHVITCSRHACMRVFLSWTNFIVPFADALKFCYGGRVQAPRRIMHDTGTLPPHPSPHRGGRQNDNLARRAPQNRKTCGWEACD